MDLALVLGGRPPRTTVPGEAASPMDFLGRRFFLWGVPLTARGRRRRAGEGASGGRFGKGRAASHHDGGWVFRRVTGSGVRRTVGGRAGSDAVHDLVHLLPRAHAIHELRREGYAGDGRQRASGGNRAGVGREGMDGC